MYILIIMILGVHGVHTHHMEFKSKISCDAAKLAINESHNKYVEAGRVGIVTKCVQK